MEIGILDFSALGNWQVTGVTDFSLKTEISMLKNAIRAGGHKLKMYYVEKCQFYFDGKNSSILYDNKPIKRCDVLIPRFNLMRELDLEISIIKQFQLMGIPVINGYLPILNAKNKLRTLQILTKKGISTPRSVVVRKLDYLVKAVKHVGGYPVVVKMPVGLFGLGVFVVESSRSLKSALDAIWSKSGQGIVIIQEYIEDSIGKECRLFITGEKVVAAMSTSVQSGDLENSIISAPRKVVRLSAREKAIAIKAVKALGLDIAAVDILRSKKGLMVLEVNSNPAFKDLTDLCKVDIASSIVDYSVQKVLNKRKK